VWLCLALVSLAAPARAQSPLRPEPAASAEGPDALQQEVIRARILLRLGRAEESLALFRELVAWRPDDRSLREDYAEVLLDAGLPERAAEEIQALLERDPRSLRLRRLRARADLERGEVGRAAERLEALAAEAPDDPGLRADWALAERRAGHWRRAMALYAGVLARDPDNPDVRAAYRELRSTHAPRLELQHTTLLQVAATHHVEEIAWRGWLGDRWWLRAGARHAIYEQDSLPGLKGFTEEVQTALLTLGLQPTAAVGLRAGLEEARREDTLRTTFRLGARYENARTTATLDLAVRELLTNPVVAIPLRGTTDRLTAELYRRVADRLVLAAHYEGRHYQVSGDTLGNAWEAAGRAEVELLRGRLQATLVPQLFFSEYSPAVGSPLREQVSFIRRQDVLGVGLVLAWEPTPALRLQAGSVGRRDLHRAITAYEVSGEARWRIRPWLEGWVLYNRNTEGGLVGGKEELFSARLDVLF
jgi:tetratricopeptide (TPR) repeat protein